ncbi:hypothetical protein [Streptomyces paromomycinus]|uniref:Uncharacterized protein n=1 Tax=Streptomyces paromomycinus TaxID=92743 RepID=A0A401W8S7_STREY|nr:hypothetical protein [Streptomyces paromomycinus]GCD45718.1 hypothetical protein GKJPGBOP_05456 [Streptomyces paromomycinus]
MIRIVGAARLAALHTDLDAARSRVQELLKALDVQWADHIQCVLEMAEQREGAERAALAATEETERLRRAAVAALLVIARQQQRIGELEEEAGRLAQDRHRWMHRYHKEARTYWDGEPPAGECCADCDRPADDGPCPEHHPGTVAGRLRACVAELEQRLTAARPAPAWLYLLRHFGEPHSLHPTQEAAKAHAVVCGAPRTGWGPSGLPPAEIAWRVEAVAVVHEQEQGAARRDAA